MIATPDGAVPHSSLAGIPPSTVYEAAGQAGGMSPAIRSLTEGLSIAGPAFTVRAIPGDNLVIFEAIERAPAGSVLVIEAGGSVTSTIWGGTSSLACKLKGIAGCVTDAAVRDVDEIRAMRFPVFCAGINVRGTVKHHPGWIGLPVVVGNVAVAPGDFVCGDTDGVVVVSAGRVDEVAHIAREKQARDLERILRLEAGESLRSVLGL